MEGQDFFLYFIIFKSGLRPTQPLMQWVLGAVSPEVKRQGNEADHSPPSSTKANKGEAVFPLPYTSSWRGAQLIKARDSFVFVLLHTPRFPSGFFLYRSPAEILWFKGRD
jgi:hypothetical protein